MTTSRRQPEITRKTFANQAGNTLVGLQRVPLNKLKPAPGSFPARLRCASRPIRSPANRCRQA